jgi:hypothetical protein
MLAGTLTGTSSVNPLPIAVCIEEGVMIQGTRSKKKWEKEVEEREKEKDNNKRKEK